jgi:hypothetical protein
LFLPSFICNLFCLFPAFFLPHNCSLFLCIYFFPCSFSTFRTSRILTEGFCVYEISS